MTKLAVIGSGATTVYLLKHLLDQLPEFGRQLAEVAIFERGQIMGMGMPYNPSTTDRYNLSNISSEELPALPQTFANWLRDQTADVLSELDIERDAISETAIYSRLALGRYLQSQYQAIVRAIAQAGVVVVEYSNSEIVDMNYRADREEVILYAANGETHPFSRVVIATGHVWPTADRPRAGYYASPWPIGKLLPEPGTYYNFTIGILGASLSAFDVVASLAHRHGTITTAPDGRMTFHCAPEAPDFQIVLHDANGWLPHLQYEQVNPLREMYRHVSREELLDLRDRHGFLRLETYFARVCRPALQRAFANDGQEEIVHFLAQPQVNFREFVERMSRQHEYDDPFVGMKWEMVEAERSVRSERPTHWKEVMDDLMYTLNFHAEWLPAEDHLRLHKEVMPFLLNVIAAMPLSSGRLLLALHAAGKLDLVPGRVALADEQPADRTTVTVTDEDQTQTIDYRLFVDCGGYDNVDVATYPFSSLPKEGTVRPARARFADPAAVSHLDPEQGALVFREGGTAYLSIGGIDIAPDHRVIDRAGSPVPAIYDIAFTHTSGVRPYAYGLQVCSETGRLVVASWVAALAVPHLV